MVDIDYVPVMQVKTKARFTDSQSCLWVYINAFNPCGDVLWGWPNPSRMSYRDGLIHVGMSFEGGSVWGCPLRLIFELELNFEAILDTTYFQRRGPPTPPLPFFSILFLSKNTLFSRFFIFIERMHRF